MARNDEGEFELVLGNKQLLSVFFLVVVLLAVFFTAGYLVGRNTMPLVAASDGAPGNNSKPLVVDSAVPVTPPAKAPEEAPKEPVSTAPQQPPETGSLRPAPEKTAEKAPEKAAEKKETAKETAKNDAKTARSNPAPSAGQMYLQLSATARAEADVMVDVLRKRNFPATLSEVPDKPGLFRVLVGPIQADNLNKTKADLQAAGFPGDKALARKF